MHQFRVIAPKVKTAAPGDILLPPFANRSTFPFAISVVPPIDLTLPAAFRNVSTFTQLRVTTGDEPNITLPSFTNESTFPALTVSEAPDDGYIYFTVFTNESSFPSGNLEIDEAPADVDILFTPFSNESTFPENVITISPIGTDDDSDDESSEGIGTDIIGDII